MSTTNQNNHTSTATVRPPEEPKSFVIRHDDEVQAITVTPTCPELESLLSVGTIDATDDLVHGYRLVRNFAPLLGFSSGFANGGLAPIANYKLLQMRHHVDWRPPNLSVLHQPVITAALTAPANPHVLRFIREHSHGLIKHGLGFNDLASLCIEIASAYPNARIAFVARNHFDAQSLFGKFADANVPATLATRERCQNPGTRVIIGTESGLANWDVIADRIDVLIFLDAAAAVGVEPGFAMYAHGRSRLFAFQHHSQVFPPRIRQFIMAAFGPEVVTVPQLGFRNRHVEVAEMRVDEPKCVESLAGFALHRKGIARHDGRNWHIASLAKAIVADDGPRIRRLCSAVSLVALVGHATIVIAADVEHAIALAERMPGWPLLLAADANLEGLSPSQVAIVHRQRRPLFFDHGIVTVANMSAIDASGLDVVIWAAGGHGIDVPPIVCDPAHGRPLLWIDVRDGHHSQLRRDSRRRRDDYAAAGWFRAGIPPVNGRIKAFLIEQSEKNHER